MKNSKIYPLLEKKIDRLEENEKASKNEDLEYNKNEIRVLISFSTIEERDEFLSENKDFLIIDKFRLIPSITTVLSSNKIRNISKEAAIKRIEEDQQIYLNINEVLELLNLRNFKMSQFNFTGKDVNIGIIDTEIQNYYESFYQSKIKRRYQSREKKNKKANKNGEHISHGTLIANLLINQLRNKDGIRLGIAPDANIYNLGLSKNNKNLFFSDILHSFDKLIKENLPLDIILISFTTNEASDGNDILSQACNLLVAKKDIIIIVPSGNFGAELKTIPSPAAASEVITVGNIRKDGAISNFFGKGPTLEGEKKPDIFFPGSKIKVLLEKNKIIEISGTSISAAIAAGLIALLKEYDRNLTSEDIKKMFSDYYRDYNKRINLIRFFKKNAIFSPKLVSYKYLIKRSLWVSVQISIIFIIIFFWKHIWNFIRLIYRF